MMTQLFGAMPPPADPDPATPENRRALSRRLLAGAIERYEAACLDWTAAYESFPPLHTPREPSGPGEVAERSAWRSLLQHADESFNHAELNLAERIHGLFAMLDPAGRLSPRDEPAYFVPRAVRHGGHVYVLAYSAFEYEPKTNIIAVHGETMVLDLEGEGARTSPVHGEASAPVHGEASAPVHGEASAPVHGEASAPVHREASAPVHREASAPVHREPLGDGSR